MTSVEQKIIRSKFPDVPEEEIQKAIFTTESFGLNLALGHAVILKRKDRKRQRTTYNVYVTRDGLLHLMHQMGKPWSLKMSKPVLATNPYTGKDDVWLEGTVEVYDPSTQVTQEYHGGVWLSEYDSDTATWKTNKGSMHFKVVEVFLYRRAANVALTPVEEMDRVLAMEGDDQPPLDHKPRGGRSRPQGDAVQSDTRAEVGRVLVELGFTPEMREEAMKFFSAVTKLEVASLDEATQGQAVAFLKRLTKDGKTDFEAARKLAEAAGVSLPQQESPPPKDGGSTGEGSQPEPKSDQPPKPPLDDEFPPPEVFE